METPHFNTYRWIRIALFNFFILAIAGLVLRYKINFPLPLLNQKFLLHGHSHFAFVGWVTLALMALMVNYLLKQGIQTNYKKYHWLLVANNITAYGMLFTFMAQGYALFSITFSTLSILVSYLFIYNYWNDLRKIKNEQHTLRWFKGALILWALSSAGAFTLAYLMANAIKVQDYFFAAIYFFLHFQYNGWFIFACFGLLSAFFNIRYQPTLAKLNKKFFIVLAITIVPTYLLSLLWLQLPAALYWMGTVSAFVQLIALVYLVRFFKYIKKHLLHPVSIAARYLWYLAFICFTLKIVLQCLSTIPYFSSFAFGFRPVVIAYLHLCFLGIISFFIIGYFNACFPQGQSLNKYGVKLFILGVILQEIVLMIQGLEMMGLHFLAHSQLILFVLAGIIGAGLALIAFKSGQKKSTANNIHSGH